MMTATNELLHEILKVIQTKIDRQEKLSLDVQQQVIRAREQLNEMHRTLQTQIHDLQSDLLRLDQRSVMIDTRLERIEGRLNLADAE